MIVGDRMLVVLVDHGRGDADRLPVVPNASWAAVISVLLSSFVAGKFSVTHFVEESLHVRWYRGGCRCSALVPLRAP